MPCDKYIHPFVVDRNPLPHHRCPYSPHSFEYRTVWYASPSAPQLPCTQFWQRQSEQGQQFHAVQADYFARWNRAASCSQFHFHTPPKCESQIGESKETDHGKASAKQCHCWSRCEENAAWELEARQLGMCELSRPREKVPRVARRDIDPRRHRSGKGLARLSSRVSRCDTPVGCGWRLAFQGDHP